MHAHTKAAGDWWARPRGDAANGPWIAEYQKSVNHRHRTTLVSILKELQPSTLLEVGAHCGPNLVRFAQEFPELTMIGVDVNADAVKAGRAWVSGQGLAARIQLNAGRLPEATSNVPSGSCDVVLSCYALAYIAPPDLDAVLYEMGRIATRAVILAEPMVLSGPANSHRTLNGYSEWAHNYRAASQWIGTWRGRALRVVSIVPPVDRLNAILVASDETQLNMP